MKKTILLCVSFCFIFSSLGLANLNSQALPWMPIPGQRVSLSPTYTPYLIKALEIDPQDGLKFSFIIQKGEEALTESQKSAEYQKLVKYFMAALTTPDEDQWVNLSPFEKNRIIKANFSKTEMGRDLLAQDYLLKQISASLTYPENGLGKKFWDRILERVQKEHGTSQIPLNAFNKVWILPDHATLLEQGNAVYIMENHLKVMMEEDYLALKNNSIHPSSPAHTLTSQIMNEIIIPELTKEVNEGKNFAPLRQVYSAMVLAAWYKRKLKESLLGKFYANRSKVKGIDTDPSIDQQIYKDYLIAFKKGVFNYIKEDASALEKVAIPRKYFAGGTTGYVHFDQEVSVVDNVAELPAKLLQDDAKGSRGFDRAMITLKQAFEYARYSLFDEHSRYYSLKSGLKFESVNAVSNDDKASENDVRILKNTLFQAFKVKEHEALIRAIWKIMGKRKPADAVHLELLTQYLTILQTINNHLFEYDINKTSDLETKQKLFYYAYHPEFQETVAVQVGKVWKGPNATKKLFAKLHQQTVEELIRLLRRTGNENVERAADETLRTISPEYAEQSKTVDGHLIQGRDDYWRNYVGEMLKLYPDQAITIKYISHEEEGFGKLDKFLTSLTPSQRTPYYKFMYWFMVHQTQWGLTFDEINLESVHSLYQLEKDFVKKVTHNLREFEDFRLVAWAMSAKNKSLMNQLYWKISSFVSQNFRLGEILDSLNPQSSANERLQEYLSVLRQFQGSPDHPAAKFYEETYRMLLVIANDKIDKSTGNGYLFEKLPFDSANRDFLSGGNLQKEFIEEFTPEGKLLFFEARTSRYMDNPKWKLVIDSLRQVFQMDKIKDEAILINSDGFDPQIIINKINAIEDPFSRLIHYLEELRSYLGMQSQGAQFYEKTYRVLLVVANNSLIDHHTQQSYLTADLDTMMGNINFMVGNSLSPLLLAEVASKIKGFNASTESFAQDAKWKEVVDSLKKVLKIDEAMKANPVKAEVNPGGIDFNSEHLELEIKRNSQGITLPLASQDLNLLEKIDGFTPTIDRIEPISRLPIVISSK